MCFSQNMQNCRNARKPPIKMSKFTLTGINIPSQRKPNMRYHKSLRVPSFQNRQRDVLASSPIRKAITSLPHRYIHITSAYNYLTSIWTIFCNDRRYLQRVNAHSTRALNLTSEYFCSPVFPTVRTGIHMSLPFQFRFWHSRTIGSSFITYNRSSWDWQLFLEHFMYIITGHNQYDGKRRDWRNIT